MDPRDGTIAMLYEQPETYSIVAGRMVAVQQMVQAVGLYTERHRLALLCPPRQHADIVAKFAFEPGISAIDRTVARNVDALGITAWHEAQLDLFTPFALRERATRPFPITMVHHTISYKSLLHGAFLRLLLARPRSFDSMICTSVAAREALQRIFGHVAERLHADHGLACEYQGRLDVIPLGTDTERFHPMPKAEARACLDLDPDVFVMLWVGRLSTVDKADLLPLIQVVAQLKQANPTRKLMLVCAGSQRPGERFGDVIASYAQSLGIADAVKVVTDQEVVGPWMAQVYSSADVFVAPTDNVQESFGLAPLEAMSAGVPQVVADWSGYRDTVRDGETGFLIPTLGAPQYRDIDDVAVLSDEPFDHLTLASGVAVESHVMCNALQRLFDDAELRTRMAHQSRARAVQHFSWPVVVAQYEALWEELAAEARAHQGEQLPPSSSYALPQYGTFFSGFPTRLLTDEVELVLLPRGLEATKRDDLQLPLPYNDEFRYLEPPLIARALAGLAHFARKGETLSVGRAVGVLTRTENNNDERRRDAVRRHLVWLVKYGYVALSPPSAD